MQSKIVTIDYKNKPIQLSVRMRICGNDLILFIHGLGCAKENFESVWSQNKLMAYSIIAVDLPGFGDSPGPDFFSYDLEEHAAVCCCLLADLPAYRVHIVGHSMGGAIGLILAEKIYDRLGSFINVEGNLIGQDCNVSRRKASITFEDFRKKQLPGMILSAALSDEPGRRLWSVFLKKADARGLYCSSRSLVSWSDSGELLKIFRKLKCNKVYIHGDKNSSLIILHMLEEIPVISISNSGHFPMNDNPDEFYDFIASIIN